MSEFAQSVPSEWTDETGVLVERPSTRPTKRPVQAVRDSLLPVATATAIAFCSVFGGSLDSIAMTDRGSGAVIAAPREGSYVSSATGDINPAVWGEVIADLRQMKTVVRDRDFDNEPEPFI